MKIIRSVVAMQKMTSEWKRQNQQIGFVATMGFFHDGHISLMEQAKKDNDILVSSIFVNPLQFGPNEDYEEYPRNEEHDTVLAKKAGVDVLFIPEKKEMYPNKMAISMSIHQRVEVLCGQSRPGHFDGVITVLTKLFNIIQPTRAYFGMKDAQQAAVVDVLIRDFNFPIELIGVPTSRETDGLAKSSRNVYLSETERREATSLYKALREGQKLIVDGEKNPDIIVKEVMDILTDKTSGTVDYVELLSYPELESVRVIDQQVILGIAVFFKHARLIDNLIFDKTGKLIDQI
ncbi:pantoate--beta-alanine ligase [Virgibacillus ainsalahensis]